MLARLKPSTTSLSIVTLTLLALLTIAPTQSWAQSIQQFVMPRSGYVSFRVMSGGEAGGVTTFGLGTSPSEFVTLFTGLPNKPSSHRSINAGFFSAGSVVPIGMFTTFGGLSGWAFSGGSDQASIVAFSDIDNSLGLGGSIYQQVAHNTWVLHLDDALSYGIDDDDNDVIIKLHIGNKPIGGG